MPRLPLTLSLALLLSAGPALAVVNLTGDAKPAAPGGFGFPIGQPGIDDDGDEIPDWIDTLGNQVNSGDADPFNVNGGAGGLAWLDSTIWADYDTTQNILVGETGYGQLEINSGSVLRYQHLVLGGASDENNGDLSLMTTGSSENFNFLSDLLSTNTPRNTFNTGGTGIVTVTGVGSVFNNDPNIIPADLQAAINFATGAGAPPSRLITDLDDVTFIPGVGPAGTTIPVNPRPDRGAANSTYDVHVGLLGNGVLNVLDGGRVEIQDALLVGTAADANGTVTVDGAGSYLGAYGRSELDDNNNRTATTELPSYIGGNGHGQMTVSGGGRADFFNGLSIGAANSSIILADVVDDPLSSGALLITGSGSTVTVAPTLVTNSAGDDLGNDADLAIGELRNLTTGAGIENLRFSPTGARVAAPDGTTTLGEGLLRIEAGGRLNVTGEGDVGIGYNGVVELRSGTLNAAGDVINDGRLDGYGTVLGQTLDTTFYSVIRGGDPNVQPGNPATAPLRISLSGGAAIDSPVFTNRGSVTGLVEINAEGDINNRGNMVISGDLNARRLVTTADSRLAGDGAFAGPLRIRLASTDQVNVVGANQPAFRNLGELAGEVDLVTPGGIVNGDDNVTTLGSNGGVIKATGSILSGTFINYGSGKVSVGQGESLSILATGTAPGLNNSLFAGQTGVRVPTVLEDGINPATADGTIDATGALFFQANLGKISVDGGSLELGRLTDTQPSGAFATVHANYFRNARFVGASVGRADGETIGTITSNDGSIVFRDGVYNTGVMAFTGGDNHVGGRVINAGNNDDMDVGIDYLGTPMDTSDDFPGIIVVSGDGTTVTFADNVENSGLISIGPFGNVVNFLGDFTNSGDIQVSTTVDNAGNTTQSSAFLQVAGTVAINGGALAIPGGPIAATSSSSSSAASSSAASAFSDGSSLTILSAGNLSEDSLFTNLDLPTLDDGLFWDIVYDTDNGEIRAEVIGSLAMGADFTGDGIVSQDDVDVWIRNAGIESGASVIQGDVDLDGDVDLADYDLLMTQLLTGVPVLVGSALGSAAVPEPTTLLLLSLAGAAVAARRR